MIKDAPKPGASFFVNRWHIMDDADESEKN